MEAALDIHDGKGSSWRRRVEPRDERWTQGTLLVLAAGLLAAAPITAGVVRAIGFDWTATADDGQIAVRAFDVLSRHPPLLGQISLTSDLSGDPTFNLGPLEYCLLALPARFGSNALLVTMGLVNTACVMGSVALAKRRGGLGLMFAVAAGIAITLHSLPANALYDLLNPYAALFPFTLLLFLAWSIACGDAFLLPLAAVAASFAVQCHLTYVVPVVGTLLLAVAGLVVSRRMHRSARRLRGWVLATALVLLVCWSAPLAEQVTHRPGNLVLVARAANADRRIMGKDAGWHATARMVGVVPWWLRDPRPPFLRLVDLLGRPAALTIVSALLIAGAAVIIAVAAARRRRVDILYAAVSSLWLCASVALVARSVPLGRNTIGLMQYILSWASPAGMWVWVTLGWSTAVLIAHVRRPTWRGTPIPALAGLALVAAASAWAIIDRGPERNGSYFRAIGTTAARVGHAVPDRRTVYLDAPASFTTLDFLPAITYALRREGTRVMVPADVAIRWGSQYHPLPGAYDWIVGIRGADARPARGSHVIARAPGRVTVTLAPAVGRRRAGRGGG